MGVQMNVPWDDGKVKLAAGAKHFDFPASMEARLIRSGLAEPLPEESLDEARAAVGMVPLVPPAIEDIEEYAGPSMTMTKAELSAMADELGVEYESDDNKAEIIRKIEEAQGS